jgi:ribosomal protein S12 methylthiotransferase
MEHIEVYLHPVGCPKANVDLEKASWALEHKGFTVVDAPAGARVGIVFGCAFIDDAKRESIDTVLDLVELKQGGALGHVIVAGCLPEKYARSACLSLPEVDAFVGNTWLDSLPAVVRDVCRGRLAVKTWTAGPFGWGQDEHRSLPRTSPWTRAVMISDGCDNACTYCSIPHMRGGLRSRDTGDILKEIEVVVEQGAAEIVLAGQDTASYGRDTGHGSLPELMAEVAARFPSRWIRLSYVNPDNMSIDVGGVMRDHANICNYVDMPIQHASPAILAAMGRRDDPGAVESGIRTLRRAVPDVALRTSVIVGFPGETEADVELLLDFLRRIEFDLVGVFAFSPQEGTPAAALKGRVPDDVTQARVIEVVSVQDEIARKRMERLVGCKLPVLVEEADGGSLTARSQYDMAEIDRVIRVAGCPARPGDMITVRIDGISAPYTWCGSYLR